MTRGSGEADQRSRFGNVQIAEHREARRNAAGSGIGENADVRKLRFVQTHQGRRELRQLHQADSALLHSRTAGSRNDDQRHFFVQAALNGPGDLFPHTAPMLPPMNFSSSAQICTLRPSSNPLPQITASGRLVAARISVRRCVYGFESTK